MNGMMSTNIVPHFFAVVAVAVVGSAAFVYNAANGTEEVVGEKYAYTYSKCARQQPGPKGISHCAKWEPAVEYRVNTIVKGPLFEYESYRVVGK
jgi:hypothetical protein